MNRSTFFSIIIPTFNRANLLKRTLESVLSQSYPYFEVLIIDDGGKDNSSDIVNSFNDNRFQYHWKENGERGAARNYGISKAIGDFALFLDSDDIMKPTYLEMLALYIAKDSTIRFIACKFDFIDENSQSISYEIPFKEGFYSYNDFLEGNYLACNYCIKLKNTKIELFNESRKFSTSEDWLFLILNLKWTKIFIVDHIGLSMLIHAGRSMSNNLQLIFDKKVVTDEILKQLDLNELEKKSLVSGSAYFCAIHYYVENKRIEALKELKSAIIHNRLKMKYLILFLKILIGRKILLNLKK